MNLMKSLLLMVSILMASAIWAEGGGDRTFERIAELRDRAEAVLVQAEQAAPGQRHVHMAEHMEMLGDMMNQLHQNHPDASMTTEQHLAWMEQHDKLVDDVLSQMMREHKLMMTEYMHK
ncbi:co-regulatory protein PtrA N-terminal domain-containing protein [Pseudomonas paeninsulae]|uniref:co-regulatory protein PtrA N-terminal domain-containing protein n=1 Tax=Pseudomonas paeninsulae TaxID=3110772 RepID=UPI002D76C04B|nr:co-regulatory protein PtrA N-terminal domain-containing protein [Pseudomonas sp. IT1137]